MERKKTEFKELEELKFSIDGEDYALFFNDIPLSNSVLICLDSKGILGRKALRSLYNWLHSDQFVAEEKLSNVTAGNVSKSFYEDNYNIPERYSIFFTNPSGREFYTLAKGLGCLGSDDGANDSPSVAVGKVRAW